MKSFAERFLDAKAVNESGMRRVKQTPEPVGQKFPIGSFVMVGKNLGGCMSHFPKDLPACIEYTYCHAFGTSDVKSYSLLIRFSENKWSSVSWYYEDQLSLITDQQLIEQFKKEILK